jgi:hypothetical protein
MFAIINQDKQIVSIVLSETALKPNWISLSGANKTATLGDIYDSKTKLFSEGKLDLPVEPKLITRGMFKLRMTQAERIATRVLALSGTPEGMVAMDFNDLLSDVPVVDLDQQEVIDGMRFLEAVGVLGEGRASEIVGAEITSKEKP